MGTLLHVQDAEGRPRGAAFLGLVVASGVVFQATWYHKTLRLPGRSQGESRQPRHTFNERGDDVKPKTQEKTLTRREALKLLLAAGSLLAAPHQAIAETEAELQAKADQTQTQLEAAQAEADAVEAELRELAAQVEQLMIEQSQTLDQIYQTQEQKLQIEEQIRQTQELIDQTEAEIAEKEAQLAAKQQVLSRRISSAYKSGAPDFIEILLSASSFEELESNIYYLDKISQNDTRMIADIRSLKEELEEKKAQLEEQRAQLEAQQAELEQRIAELEELNSLQQQQIDATNAAKAEVSDRLASLSDQVLSLIAQHDEELLAVERERERAAAAAAAAAAASSSGGTYVDPSNFTQGATGSQQAVINACYSTPSPGAGLCAWWVEDVFENAGIGSWGGNACDLYYSYCYLSDMSAIEPGMIVAVSTYPTGGLGAIYGHVGVYIGGGMVMENIGYINTTSLSNWVANYSGSVTPRWGWMGGVALA